MSSKFVKKDYKNLLKAKIKTLFEFLRNVYKGIDNNIVSSLNEEYEEELLTLAEMIPNDWIDGFYDSVELVFDMVGSINVNKLAGVIKKHSKARLWFSVNTCSAFINNFVIDKGYGRQMEKAIINICYKFKPIFNAVDKLLSNPGGVLEKIATIYQNDNNDNNDILNNLM